MRVGYWSTLGAIITSISYAVPQVLQVLGILPDPIDRILIFAPSLLLAPCFVVSMASAYGVASPEDRPLRLAALCFAVLYGGLARSFTSTSSAWSFRANLRARRRVMRGWPVADFVSR